LAAPLPIDEHLPRLTDLLRERRFAVLVAPPGAGKSTRVPPALLAFGRVILLQPRRVAARAIARRIAGEQGWDLGGDIGWQVRFERMFGPRTRLLVATEGILTSRLLADPLLWEFAVVVIDEFHERSLHADLGLALAKQAAAARDDLRIVVMSATLDAERASAFLGGCPVLDVPGRMFPVEIAHAPELSPGSAVRQALAREGGHALVFLPGAGEIRALAEELSRPPVPARVLPLHGSLDAQSQDAALDPSIGRKVILATNIAETSLTVEGVTDVIDTGRHKVLRYDEAIGLDLEWIPLDSAQQRAGRAGRTQAGRAIRLWDPRNILRAHREPEIARVDMAGPLLDILAWGSDPDRFEWFEPPPPGRIERALALLERLGAVQGRRITALGRTLRRLPLHPRLGRVLLTAARSSRAAAACAVLSEGWRGPSLPVTATSSDILLRADAIGQAPRAVQTAAVELERLARRTRQEITDQEEAAFGETPAMRRGPSPYPGSNPSAGDHLDHDRREGRDGRDGREGRDGCDGREGRDDHEAGDDEDLRRALFAGYPDRVARRREPGSPRVVLSNGHGAALARESGVREGEWLVALDLQAAPRGARAEALVHAASRIERSWLAATRRGLDHEFDAREGSVRAFEREWYDELMLSERPVPPDPIAAAGLLAAALRARGLDERGQALRRRLRFAGIAWDEDGWIERACQGRRVLSEVDLAGAIPREVALALDRLAPETIRVPSGRSARLEYHEDGTVSASVKLQELFGLAETPRVGPRREPVTLLLLAPNGRPVQTTRDLRSFWEGVYPEVRRELRGRYPKHPWPEDPWSATPTHRTKPR
jgi:ATP-dependent helicase HrpB